MDRFRLGCLALAVMVGGVGTAPAQEGLELRPGVGRGGAGFYAPGQWGLIRSTIVNHSPSDQTPMLTLSTGVSGNVQFAKQLWVPSKSQLSTQTPIFLVEMPENPKEGLQIDARLIVNEVPIQSDIGLVNVRDQGVETAVIAGAEQEDAISASSAVREAAGLPPTTAYLSASSMPAIAAGWGGVDAVVFSSPDALPDPAQMEALRRWLFAGGRLWIHLDRVSPDFPVRLLGDLWRVTPLDTVELTDFTLEGGDVTQRVQRDYPYRFLRVAAPELETVFSIGGYPACLRQKVGAGELLITTLEARAWLTPDSKAGPALKELDWFARPQDSRLFEEEGPPPHKPVLGLIASEQIGHTVIAREPVFAVLAVFTLALLVSGLFLAQRGRLAHLGWAAPVLAVVAAGVLLALGLVRQTRTPFTMASTQLVKVLGDGRYADVQAQLSVYTPPGTDRTGAYLHGEQSVAWPDLSGQGGKTIRLVWKDRTRWAFEGLDLNEGAIQAADLRTVASLPQPAVAVARFTEQGLVGRIQAGSLESLEDPVAVTPSGKATAELGEGGEFVVTYIDPLGPDQFYPGSLLNQRQIARQEVLRMLLATRDLIDGPAIVGWSTGVDIPAAVSDNAAYNSSALVVVPLQFQPIAPGTKVSVPASFMTMRPYRDPDKKFLGSPIYDERNGQWVPNVNMTQHALMQFILPESVRSMRVESARLTLELRAPGRTYAPALLRNGSLKELDREENPMGRITVELTGENAPTVTPDGGVVVGIHVSEPLDPDPSKSQPWSLSDLEVSVTGTVIEPETPSESAP